MIRPLAKTSTHTKHNSAILERVFFELEMIRFKKPAHNGKLIRENRMFFKLSTCSRFCFCKKIIAKHRTPVTPHMIPTDFFAKVQIPRYPSTNRKKQRKILFLKFKHIGYWKQCHVNMSQDIDMLANMKTINKADASFSRPLNFEEVKYSGTRRSVSVPQYNIGRPL